MSDDCYSFRTALIYGFGIIVNMAEEYIDSRKHTD